jgi:hypothetical protein
VTPSRGRGEKSSDSPLAERVAGAPLAVSDDALLHFRWDLDKTYLHTEFDTIRDLWRTFRQQAKDKKNVAGARTLLQELLSPEAKGDNPRHVTFISGSPRQMRKVLSDKLRIDGVEPDTFILKPNLSNLLRGRFRAIGDQLGYKLAALIESRVDGPLVRELLFGDDAEQDALIYCLYADLLSGVVSADRLAGILAGTALYRSDIERILEAHSGIKPTTSARVERIFIRLDRRSPTARFDVFGQRVVPTYNYFQAAVVLYVDGRLPVTALRRVTSSMRAEGYTVSRLGNSMQDLVRRGLVDPTALNTVGEALETTPENERASSAGYVDSFRSALARLPAERIAVDREPTSIDYERLCAEAMKYKRVRERLLNIGPLRD